MKKNEKNKEFSNSFVNLDELIYAPIHAVAQSNIKLGGSTMDLIASAGDINPADETNTIHLKTVNLAYEQINNDNVSGKVLEEIGLKIPLISIVPIANLQIKKTKVSFDAEIKRVKKNKKGNLYNIESRICSPSKQRRSGDELPKVSFEIDLESVPVPEGLARFIDILNINPVPEILSSKQIDDNGMVIVGNKALYYQEIKDLKLKETRLNATGEKLTDLISQKKLIFDSILKECNKSGTFDTIITDDNNKNISIIYSLIENSDKADKLKELYQEIHEMTDIYKRVMNNAMKLSEERLRKELNHINEELDDEKR